MTDSLIALIEAAKIEKPSMMYDSDDIGFNSGLDVGIDIIRQHTAAQESAASSFAVKMGDASTRKDEACAGTTVSIAASAIAAYPTSCPVCNGNDGDAPCAYTTERPSGCLRVKRLNTSEIPVISDECKYAFDVEFLKNEWSYEDESTSDKWHGFQLGWNARNPEPVIVSLEKCGQAIEGLLAAAGPIYMYSEDEIAKAVLDAAGVAYVD